MTGTHTLSDLRLMSGFFMSNDGIVRTRFGRNTINYWCECENGKYYNFKCSTVY